VTEQHGLVHKTDGGYRLSFQRPYATTPDDLWEAMTSPPRVKRWLADLTGDLRPGGRYRLDFGGGSDPDQVSEGTIEVCEPPSSLKVTWSFGPRGDSVVEAFLTSDGSTTWLSLRHSLPTDQAPGYGAGWHAYLDMRRRRSRALRSLSGIRHSFDTSPTIRDS
jgi:uncharacterized protein YndB with AHSA1/START domain